MDNNRWLVLSAVILASGTSHGAIATSSDDLWDISKGATVTGNSPVLSWGGYFTSNIDSLFGYVNTGFVEPTETIFGDAPRGFVHWVEWQTPTPITLRSFVMDAGHDTAGRDASARGFSRFTLSAFDETSGTYETLFELFPGNPYNTTATPPYALMEFPTYASMLLAANVIPTTASRFRAEFVQYGDRIPSALGPRVRELDGYDTFYSGISNPVPEPSGIAIWFILAVGILLLDFRNPQRLSFRIRCLTRRHPNPRTPGIRP